MSRTDIFLSYARQDRPTARLFAQCLTEEGFKVWWDASLQAGETFDEVIERNLRDSKAVVVLWSIASVASRWVRAEATLAHRADKLVPAMIEACDRPIIFELTHAAELSDWTGDKSDARWQTFVSDLRRLVRDPSDEAQPVAQPAAPSVEVPVRAQVESRQSGRAEPAEREPEEFNGDLQAEVHYLEIEPGELVGDPIPVRSSGVRIGRVAPADIVLPDKSISREHCIVGLANDELLVTDLNSTNGTYIDDVRISRATVLPVGSVLRVGQVALRHAVRTGCAPLPGAMHKGASGRGLEAGRVAATS